MNFTNRKIFWCDCGAHAISVERDKYALTEIDGKPVYTIDTQIQLWNAINNYTENKFFFKRRLAMVWDFLRGKLFTDGVILKEEELKKLIDALQSEPVLNE